MAEEKKPGLLKRVFSFGFGKKKKAEADEAAAAKAEEQARQEAERKAQLEKAEAERIAAEQAKREEERAAIQKAAQEEAARLKAEKAASEEKERLAAEQAAKEEQERLAAEKAAEEQRAAEEAERLAAEKKEAEEAAQREAEEEAAAAAKAKADAEALAQEQAQQEAEAKRKADEAAAQEKVEQQAKKEKEEIEAEKLAAEKEAAEQAALEKAEAERLAAEEAKQEAQEQAAKEEADRQAKLAAEQAAEAERIAAEEEQARLEAEAAEHQRQAELEAEETRRREEEAKAAAEAAQASDPEPEPEQEEEEERREGWFKRMRKGLARSSSTLTENITSVFTKKKLDEDTLQDLEDILIQADLGVETAMNVTDALASQRMGKDVTDEEVRQVMADEIAKTLEPVAQPLELDLEHQPHVILVVGVNGSGKTTTIGKISQKLYDAGFSTLLVAGDTFRAAAIEQLHIWGDRTQAPVMSRENGADAAGLAFDAYAEAQAQKKDVMLMDTAGRLQNRKELMDELEKIIRVLKKQDPTAPHTVLLTLDATTGQNALNQVEIFKDVAGVNGLVMTKLDGTARGGILVAISAKHKLPVYFIGVGEQVEDLEPFEADVFARAIAGLDQE